jgi:tetratricopeptide (TPR) repeat protein
MNNEELQTLVLRNMAAISEMRQQLTDISSKELRVERAIQDLRQRLRLFLDRFDRDQYKATDQRLLAAALANELLIFDRLGYDLSSSGSAFLLAVGALLDGRNRVALDHLERFLQSADPADPNFRNASYLAGMITYNRREFQRSADFFAVAYERSPVDQRDWQARIYVGELAYFMRKPAQEIERIFLSVEEALSGPEDPEQATIRSFLRATLYLKWGNCYVSTFLPPREANAMVNNQAAIQYFKKARRSCPTSISPDSLLPAVIDYSLAQALLLANAVDMDLDKTPSELFKDVFDRLRRIVLSKREEIILAQCYLMLGTCVVFSSYLSNDIGEIYLEYARHQTLIVPSDVCFYSGVTKELLSRTDFVKQIDFYANELDRQVARR